MPAHASATFSKVAENHHQAITEVLYIPVSEIMLISITAVLPRKMQRIELTLNQKAFDEIKNALKKTIHTLVDLDFEDGKLDEAIKSFLDAEKMQINLTFHLHPNDVIFVRNLTKEKVPQEILNRVRKLRRDRA